MIIFIEYRTTEMSMLKKLFIVLYQMIKYQKIIQKFEFEYLFYLS